MEVLFVFFVPFSSIDKGKRPKMNTNSIEGENLKVDVSIMPTCGCGQEMDDLKKSGARL